MKVNSPAKNGGARRRRVTPAAGFICAAFARGFEVENSELEDGDEDDLENDLVPRTCESQRGQVCGRRNMRGNGHFPL